jgi:hypothetical protein
MTFHRITWVLVALAMGILSFAVAATGCGSTQAAPDLTAADAAPDGTGCSVQGDHCGANGDCCSGVCDTKTSQCTAGVGICSPGGATCKTSTDCCSVSCVNGVCGAGKCTSDNQACTQGSECCGGKCDTSDAGTAGKVCIPLNTTCKTAGNSCTDNSQCCSKLCQNGTCDLASSYCIQNGDVCSRGEDCCGGICTIASGATLGTCGAPPAGATFCNGGLDGTVCGDCNECCSRLCAPYGPTGVKICQPANGCHIDGDLCRKDSDCCGAPGTGLPGDGNVHCEIQPGFTIGICRNPTGCNPEGNVCHYKNYQCSISSARNDCCGALGVNTDCTLDAVGVPRCHTIGTCKNPGEQCAFSGDCCNGIPCVPDSSGVLRCNTSGGDGGVCVPVTGPCTTDADCCSGYSCIVPLGSTQGTCGTKAPPTGSDAGTNDGGGFTCTLYGQACTTANECCNGVPCTAADGVSACNGTAGCHCVAPIPR